MPAVRERAAKEHSLRQNGSQGKRDAPGLARRREQSVSFVDERLGTRSKGGPGTGGEPRNMRPMVGKGGAQALFVTILQKKVMVNSSLRGCVIFHRYRHRRGM